MHSRMTSKGQVTIPKSLRDRLALAPGDLVSFDLEPDGRVVLRRSEAGAAPSVFEQLRGSATAGLSSDEILGLTRGTREERERGESAA